MGVATGAAAGVADGQAVAVSQPGQVRGLVPAARDMMDITPGLMARNFAYLGSIWLIAIGALVGAALEPTWYTIAIAVLLVSSRQQALLNVEHEAIHGKFVRSRRWNGIIGRYLCAAPVGSPYSASQKRHLTHHRLLGTPEDPDHDLHAGPEKRTRTGLAKHFVGGLLGGYAGMVLMGPKTSAASNPAAARHDLFSIILMQLVLGATLTLALEPWVYPALWLVPLLTVTVLFHLIRSFVEHAISEQEEAEHSNRLITIESNPLERGLVAPFGMNYHAEHHLLPSVPAPRLRALKRRLGDREETPPVLVRRSYAGAVLAYVRALRA